VSETAITLRVECKILSEHDARLAVNQGKAVWTWCSQGVANWVEMRFGATDAIAYLFPYDPIDLPSDSDVGENRRGGRLFRRKGNRP